MATTMTYRPLGRCGTKVSVLGLGGWTTYGGSVKDEGAVRRILRHAYDAGVNFFDIADVYAMGEAEKMMGGALRELPRHRLVIASKLYWPMSEDVNDRGLSRKHVMESVEKSLRRIGTDYLDVYYCHRFDAETPVEETVRAMDDLVRQGKILYWGTSEWTGSQLREAWRISDRRNAHGPQVEQPQYNLLERGKVERDVRPAATELGMGLVAWSPLASGLLTGKCDSGTPPPDSRLSRIEWLRAQSLQPARLEKVRALKRIADEIGCSRAQLAIAWVIAQPGLSSALLGASRGEQLEENLGALDVALDAATSARIDALFQG